MKESILKDLQEIILSESKINIGTISPEMTFAELGIDSMERIRVVIKVERKYSIEFTEKEAAKIDTIGDLVNYIESNCEVAN